MLIQLNPNKFHNWKVQKIAIIGPDAIGISMAALLADAKIKIGSNEPAQVMVVQPDSDESVMEGLDPGLNTFAKEAIAAGLLSATNGYEQLTDADVILICVQIDKKVDGYEPDYGSLFETLTNLALALQQKPADKIPLLIFESTLAPSSMITFIKELFADFDLEEGQDLLLGNSPNKVIPGRLVESITQSDKLVAGLHPETPRMIRELYRHIVTGGRLFLTNSMTAEVTKSLENACRDVRIAFSTEIVRYCDEQDIDFYAVRDQVNKRLSQRQQAFYIPNAVPSSGMLIPMLGVGGHGLPKDGILLWWRKIDSGADIANSLILQSRLINDQSPLKTIELMEQHFGPIKGKKITILGMAYRSNAEDTFNAPSISLALKLLRKGCSIRLQDPYVKKDDPNLMQLQLDQYFTNQLDEALSEADYIIFGNAHTDYSDGSSIFSKAPRLRGVVDACNLYQQADVVSRGYAYTGIGRGHQTPSPGFIDFVYNSFKTVEKGLANEVYDLITFLNQNFAIDSFNEIRFEEVQQLSASYNNGYLIDQPGPVEEIPNYRGFTTRLAACAKEQYIMST